VDGSYARKTCLVRQKMIGRFSILLVVGVNHIGQSVYRYRPSLVLQAKPDGLTTDTVVRNASISAQKCVTMMNRRIHAPPL
jgi:hypothetical protein